MLYICIDYLLKISLKILNKYNIVDWLNIKYYFFCDIHSLEMQQSDILTLLSANVKNLNYCNRFTLVLIKLTTQWKSLSKKETHQATISSKLTKLITKLNSLPESLPQFQTFLKLLLFVLKNTVKEPSINSVNTPDALLTLHQDGFQELLPISWPKNSKNQDF
jgi:hypothetical protein